MNSAYIHCKLANWRI